MIDEKGRLFKRVSIIDILLLVAIIVVAAGFAYREISPRLQLIINPTDVFYITLESNRLRGVNVDAIDYGDIMFRLHDTHPMGTVVGMTVGPAVEILQRADGSAVLVEMEERYRIVLTLEARGSITETGYFVNGTDHIAPGSEIILVSNRVYLPVVFVYSLHRERP